MDGETIVGFVIQAILWFLFYQAGYKNGQEDFLNQQLREQSNDPTPPQHLPSQPQKPHP